LSISPARMNIRQDQIDRCEVRFAMLRLARSSFRFVQPVEVKQHCAQIEISLGVTGVMF